MKKFKIAVIIENKKICKWQLESLMLSSDLIDVEIVLNCENSFKRNIKFSNLFYYCFAYFFAKIDERTLVDYPDFLGVVKSFKSTKFKNRQSLPTNVIRELREKKIDFIVKFGMGLLEIPSSLREVPILSFHHGDPSKYRGRPAIFYEQINGEKKIGIMIQILTNSLDGGPMLAFAEAPSITYSYRKTVRTVYSTSKFLLRKAILAYSQGNTIKYIPSRISYKLPSNALVLKLLFFLILRFCKKILHTGFYDRKWQISIKREELDLLAKNELDLQHCQRVPQSKCHSFIADPFYSSDGRYLRYEGLLRKTGLGEIVQVPVNNLGDRRILIHGPHLSYPMSYLVDHFERIIPEVSSLKAVYTFKVKQGEVVDCEVLPEFKNLAIKDPTIIQHNGVNYCFFTEGTTASSILHLWVKTNEDSKFNPHPCSPICLSPSSARMGGNLIKYNGDLFRVGQCCDETYGGSLKILKINMLSPVSYEEVCVGSVGVKGAYGPHTINVNPATNEIVFDYFHFVFNPFAGIMRVYHFIYSIFSYDKKRVNFSNDKT